MVKIQYNIQLGFISRKKLPSKSLLMYKFFRSACCFFSSLFSFWLRIVYVTFDIVLDTTHWLRWKTLLCVIFGFSSKDVPIQSLFVRLYATYYRSHTNSFDFYFYFFKSDHFRSDQHVHAFEKFMSTITDDVVRNRFDMNEVTTDQWPLIFNRIT